MRAKVTDNEILGRVDKEALVVGAGFDECAVFPDRVDLWVAKGVGSFRNGTTLCQLISHNKPT